MNDYLSLTEYAKLHGLSRPWVWRLIQSERIPAVRIGATWAIHKDTPKPEDNRVKSGKYKNWRKKEAVSTE